MPRRCTVCDHAGRADIDRALVRGVAYRRIAKQHALSESAVFRHQKEHLPRLLVEAKEAEEAADADSLLSEVRALHRRTLTLLDTAEDAGDLGVALRAIREARGNVELLARLAGELQEGHVVNVTLSPEWTALRVTILAALEPYPAARLALATALDDAGTCA